MKTLQLYSTDPIDTLEYPDASRGNLLLSSSALDIFTDFRKAEPLVVSIDTTIAHAKAVMQASHVHLLLVENHGAFCGVVSMNDIEPQEILKQVSQGYDRSELTVREFLRGRATLKAFSLEELHGASVADIVRALQGSGEQHCLVIDRARHRIRGIIAASAVAKKLCLPVTFSKRPTFTEIFDAIHRPRHGESHLAAVQ